jgi:selenide,water dikinase
LIGPETSDDTGVFIYDEDRYLIATTDFFTPIADDPFTFGAIAASNALSDIYAMGGKPLFALSLVMFPEKKYPLEILIEILNGAIQKASIEGNCPVIGGHSVGDDEMKFGLAITGEVKKENLITNSKARAGDTIILTKPLGTGIINTAIKAGEASEEAEKESIDTMLQLSDRASELMVSEGVKCATDITGFGLLGHSFEVCKASNIGIKLFSDNIPLIQEALEHASMGIMPGGLFKNIDYVKEFIKFKGDISQEIQSVLHDPQTSGGLLIFIKPERAEAILEKLIEAGYTHSRIIGEVLDYPRGVIEIV